jgi:alcohol dehydrogenase, propanol-preferring
LPDGLGDGLRRSGVRRLHQEWRLCRVLIADPNYVAHIPAGLDPKQAAPLICAGITTYKGIKETEAKARRVDRHLRRGGLGHLAIQYAKVMGLQVCAVDIDDGKLAHAKKLGADFVVNAKTGDPGRGRQEGHQRRRAWRPDHRAVARRLQAGRRHDAQARHLRPGRAAAGRVPVPLFDVVANCITIRGSFVGTREDMAETLAFAAEGKVKADIELQPLSAINDIFERLADAACRPDHRGGGHGTERAAGAGRHCH